MDTAQEALFKAMLNEMWFSETDGDVEFSLGYFGWVHNHPQDIWEIRNAFDDVIETYGPIADEQIVGVWWASINSNGIIRIEKIGDANPSVSTLKDFADNPACEKARKRFQDTVRDYVDWNNESEGEF